MSTWIESSLSEIELANKIAGSISKDIVGIENQCHILNIVADLLATKSNHFPVVENDNLLDWSIELIESYPELLSIDLSTPFPDCPQALTSNFFSRLAYEINIIEANPVDSGIVGTPFTLVFDMVTLAAIGWLTKERIDKQYLDLFQGRSDSNRFESKTLKRLQSVKWYDPSIGGGAFPLAILQFSQQLGLNLEYTIGSLWGNDINPLFVTATRIRTALFLSTNTSNTYRECRRVTEVQFSTSDSLDASSQKRAPKYLKPDIVIGNPPYVRAERISKPLKLRLAQDYPSISGGQVDLYSYFIAHGLDTLNDDGVLCYVSPANFQHSRYAEKVRDFINEYGYLQAIFDFDELPVFENASVHTSVYAIKKTSKKYPAIAYSFKQLPSTFPIFNGIQLSQEISELNIGKQGWYIHHQNTSNILDLLSTNAAPLIKYVGNIYSGVKSGYKNAYIIDETLATLFLQEEETAQFVKHLLQPVHIKRWQTKWKNSYLVYIRKGQEVPHNTALMKHLLKYETQLRERSDIKGHSTWYGLRECSYCSIFYEPKIVFPDIASQCRFALDTDGFFVSDGAFIIPRGDYFLLGLLNSCVGDFYFRSRCSSIGNPQNRGRLRFKKTYVQDFPVPYSVPAHAKAEIEALTFALTQEPYLPELAMKIDEIVMSIYSIPNHYQETLLLGKNYELS